MSLNNTFQLKGPTLDVSVALEHIINGGLTIDVRAPVEFESGTFPNSVNSPILNNDERALIGTVYKKEGKDSAVSLGFELVSGANKMDKVNSWCKILKDNPKALVFCFRGGMRSQIAQSWIQEFGYSVFRVEGGYKALRNLLVAQFEQMLLKQPIIIISGPTGSAKTHFINELTCHNLNSIDLERMANHRGSAFGKRGSQPSQSNFENQIMTSSLKLAQKEMPLIFEDESRLIGRNVIPEKLFISMRASPIVWIDEPIESRVETVLKDYVLESSIVSNPGSLQARAIFDGFKASLDEIRKKLGSERHAEIRKDIQAAQDLSIDKNDHSAHRTWIHKLLVHYYDPMYLGSLEKRRPKVLFRGPKSEALKFLTSHYGNAT